MIALARVLGIVLLFLAADTRPQEPQILSLIDAYNLARANATDLAIARYRLDGAEAERDVALGQILPQASLFGQWSKNKVDFDIGPASYVEDLSLIHI